MFYLTLPGLSGGINGPDTLDPNLTSPSSIIAKIIPYTLAFAGIILFLMLIFGGITMLSSAGNPEGIKKGQQMLVNALIGFVIIFVAFWIMQALQIIFGLKLGY